MRINFKSLNRFVTLVALCLVVFQTASAQNQNNVAAIEHEVGEFFDSYAEDLRSARREAIANRYDPRGYYRMGNGEKTLESFEAVKNRYLTKWTGPKSFQWKDISIEVLSSDAVLVVGLFDWQRATGETRTFLTPDCW